MINICKRHIKNIVFILTAILVITFLPPLKAQAASVSLSTYNLSIQSGGSASFSITPNGATGRVNISTDGPISVSTSSAWIEGGSQSVTVSGNSAGSGHVYVELASVGADDGSGDLSGTLTINVSVYNAQNNNNYSNDDYYYEEGVDVEENKFDVTIDEKEYTIVTDLSEVTLPQGFTKADGSYGIETVNVAKYVTADKQEEIVLYALAPKDGGDVVFLTFNEAKAEFKEPKTIKQGDNIYYLLNIPSTFKLPENYQIKEIALGDISNNVVLSKDIKDSEFVYVYILHNGEEGFYSYDTKENTIQRCPDLESKLTPQVVVEVEETNNNDNKTMVIVIGVAALCVVIMGIFLIILIAKRKKEKKDEEEESFLFNEIDDIEDFEIPEEQELEDDDSVELDVIDLSVDSIESNETEEIDETEESDGLNLIDLTKKSKEED